MKERHRSFLPLSQKNGRREEGRGQKARKSLLIHKRGREKEGEEAIPPIMALP